MTGPIPSKSIQEIRINPIGGEQVVVSTARSLRPKEKEQPAPFDSRPYVQECPFCKGNEDKTPPAIATIPGRDWQIRLIPNKFPLLDMNQADSDVVFGMQQVMAGFGIHELFVDNTSHGIRVHEMTVEHLSLLFSTYRNRSREIFSLSSNIRSVLVFKNFGPASGGSIAHTHSQILGLPVVPTRVEAEILRGQAHEQKFGCCLFCSLVNEALTFQASFANLETGQVERSIEIGQYVVERGDHFVAIKPFASRYEWEVIILPLQHEADFTRVPDSHLEDLGRVFKRTMARLHSVIGGMQYNFFIHSLPHAKQYEGSESSYHWHMEIIPRTNVPTGFELSSGLYTIGISPEQAAKQLRDFVIED